mmetsp:Transcript_8036/g.17942  ORF Transcript_8036/g.17942 Transcript_8036/m.17942 type:complete len:515 (-) Transcript_8036:136-1680(-)
MNTSTCLAIALLLLVGPSEGRRIRGGSLLKTKGDDAETTTTLFSKLRRQLNSDSGNGAEEGATPAPSSPPTAQPTTSPTTSTDAPSTSGAPTLSDAPTAIPSPQPTDTPTAAWSTVRTALVNGNYTLWDGIEFTAGQESYWVKALEFLEATSDGMPDWRIGQRYALACIFYATNGVATPITDSYFWPGFTFDWLQKWLLEDSYTLAQRREECDWHGVVCDANGVVTELNLNQNYLTGTFPKETVILAPSLKILNLERNTLLSNRGKDETWFLGQLTQLTLLNLAETSFEYDMGLPPALEHLVNLEYLIASETLFSGPIDDYIFANMNSLQSLDLQVNNFEGDLPMTLKNLPLKYVYLGATSLNGDLSTFIGDGSQFAELQELWLDGNDITGPIPTQLGGITTLKSLSLTSNELDGQIPSELAALTNMAQMFFYRNKLTGAIPTEIASLTKLETFMVHENDLTGAMPNGMCKPQGGGTFERLTADCHEEVSCYFGNSANNCCTCCGDCTPTGPWT